MTRERNEIDRERKVLKIRAEIDQPKVVMERRERYAFEETQKSAATNSYGTQNAMIALTAAMALVIAEYFE